MVKGHCPIDQYLNRMRTVHISHHCQDENGRVIERILADS